MIETRIDSYAEIRNSKGREGGNGEMIQNIAMYLNQASNTKSYFGEGSVYLGNDVTQLLECVSIEVPMLYRDAILPFIERVFDPEYRVPVCQKTQLEI